MTSHTLENRISISTSGSLVRHWRELLPVFYIGISAGFLLCGYEFIRSPSNSLFTRAYGKENLPLVQALMPLGVIAILFFYARLLTLLGPRRTLMVTSIGSGLAILGCYLAVDAGIAIFSGVLYIVREAYVILLIEQYWSLLNSILADGTARRVNGPVCGISSIGAIAGGFLVAAMAPKMGTGAMLLFAAGACLPAAFFSDMAYRRLGREPARETHVTSGGELGVGLFSKHRVLFMLVGLVLLTQVVSTVSGLAFQGIVVDTFQDIDQQTAWQGSFYGTVNVFAAIFQFIISPILLRRVSLAAVHIAILLIQIGTCLYAFFNPTLLPIACTFLVFKVFDYSLFRAAKEILYIPLPFDARFRAKELIDVFGYRFGKGGTSLLVTFFQKAGMVFSEATYSLIGLVAVFGWLGLVLPLSRYYRIAPDKT